MIAPVQQNVSAALLLALGGFAILSVGDALVKTMAGQWPGTAVAMLRYSAGAIGLAALVALTEGRRAFRMPMPWLQLARGAGVALATICFFLAVMAMPLADATAIQFTSPIITLATLLLAGTGPAQFQFGAPSAGVVIKCLIVACTATIGHMLIYMAAVRASAAVVAPMTYVQLLVAAALGWLIFGTVPDLSTCAGAALIIAGGLLLWHTQKPKVVPEPE